MDEKTSALRDIFLEVADDEEVTESQRETHGSLASDEAVEERLDEVIERMRSALDFDTDRDTEAYVELVRRFYAGESDAEIASALDDEAAAIRRSRFDLHLLRDADLDAPVEPPALRTAFADADVEAVADEFDVSVETAQRWKRALDTRDEIQRVTDRYREEFENVLRDRELAERLTSTVQRDGLDDATAGQETNEESDISF